MFDLAAAARSESLSWNRAWGRGSPGATGEGGQRPWSTAGAGRTRAAQGRCRLLAGVGEGFPVVLSEMATAAGNAPGAHPGWGKPGLHRSRFRSLWVGGRSLLCPAGPALLLALCRPAGPGAPARMGKGRVRELHPGGRRGSKEGGRAPYCPLMADRICGCPAAWAFSRGPCAIKVWYFGTE